MNVGVRIVPGCVARLGGGGGRGGAAAVFFSGLCKWPGHYTWWV